MGAHIVGWLKANWFGILGIVIGVWVSFALRPRPRVRYWVTADNAVSYIWGATHTSLYLRNVGSEPIDAGRWRVPLSVSVKADITKVEVAGISRPGIAASGEVDQDQPQRANLLVSELDPGDQVKFAIQHKKVSTAPQLSGEIQGARESLQRTLTVRQRLLGAYTLLLWGLPLDYIELASIAWLVATPFSIVGSLQDILFLLSSPLAFMLLGLLLPRHDNEQRNARDLSMFCGGLIVMVILRVSALIIAFVEGYQLWYPQFAAYVVAVWAVLRIVGAPIGAYAAGLISTEGTVSTSPAIATFVGGLCSVVFAGFVVADAKVGIQIMVGLACILVWAMIRLDRKVMLYRINATLGSPGGLPMIRPPQG